MTREDKEKLARFLDLSADYLGGGYKREREDYAFSDDPLPREYTREPGAETAVYAAECKDDLYASDSASGAAKDSLELIAEEIRSCTKCGLCRTRTQAVPGEGVSSPLLLVIGEGPGADEDRTGRPFVGKAGQLLDRMLASIGLSREKNCFIANAVKCRPPDNRDPLPEESSSCASFLERQTVLLKPRIILTVGRISSQILLQTSEGIGKLRGHFTEYKGIPLLPTFHPSALLRDENLKRPAWEDLKTLRAELSRLDEEYRRQNEELPGS
ncbi:uracil-DNA glycosylase [Treponema sp. OttesenSCG-928-L16]|nr:uracil-DNA glycosylase [Treponema sp. OttesenSCG-928-L16]